MLCVHGTGTDKEEKPKKSHRLLRLYSKPYKVVSTREDLNLPRPGSFGLDTDPLGEIL